jgi:hypothetical protein
MEGVREIGWLPIVGLEEVCGRWRPVDTKDSHIRSHC